MIVLGRRVQRPTRWWDLIGWWDELTAPIKGAAHRRGVHLCQCVVRGHAWVPSGTERVQVCRRACCRGCTVHAVRYGPLADGSYRAGFAEEFTL